MKYPSSNEIMEQIHLMASIPANSKNERAFELRDVRDCAVRLLDGEEEPDVKDPLTTENTEIERRQRAESLLDDFRELLIEWHNLDLSEDTADQVIQLCSEQVEGILQNYNGYRGVNK